jgi:hypothetical protein
MMLSSWLLVALRFHEVDAEGGLDARPVLVAGEAVVADELLVDDLLELPHAATKVSTDSPHTIERRFM